jgi:hypothetical protein
MPQHFRRCCWIITTIALFQSAHVDAQGASQPIFDGKTFQGWTMLSGKPVKDGWEIVDGAIHLKPSHRSTGNIVTEKEYGDFALTFEWKISPGGNSGLKYRVREYSGRSLGCEYQIIDDAHHSDGLTPNHRTAALYDLYEPQAERYLNPPGEFNQTRIVVRHNHVEHWLNGRLVVSATIGSPEWQARLAKSKFAQVPDFSLNTYGKLMLTDHGDEVWYRNFEIHEFTDICSASQPCRRHCQKHCRQRCRPVRNWLRSLRCRR